MRVWEERVLEVSRRLLGEEHPDTLRAMAALATTVRAQAEVGKPPVLAAMRRIGARLRAPTRR